ncbi:Myoneurin [Echinococcus granulosus]|uniref:Zinc finger C2H2 type n=1 Tax=Echinococcus granulosus TaxID=6210 RepID=A0A068WSI5_ECHGR|nr:Myoneurin [Echinococcus granulosus]CDS21427.1 zinc finger C2H2 type [Echinococcus granulosus]
MDASNELANAAKVDPDGYALDDDVDLTNIAPMPKHVFLNTLPGHLAPFPTIPRSRYDTDRNQREFYGQESFLNAFITTHCREHTSAPIVNGLTESQQHQQQQQQSRRAPSAPLKRNQCSLCLRVFANSASLKQHMRLHRGEKPFKCRFCDKTSATMCNILTHERTHTRERPYKCTLCSADFSSSSNLKTHMRTHSGDRPFRCNLCDRRFVTSNALTTHLRAHWGLRLHPCPDCDRQFSTSSNLRVHHRTVHLGIKQYHCMVCGKSFATSSNLNAHSRQHPESAYLVKYTGSSTFCPSTQQSTDTTVVNVAEVESPVEASVTVATTTTAAAAVVSAAAVAAAEENGEEAVGMLVTPTGYNHAPTLLPVTLSPSPVGTSRKFAKVTVYCPGDVEIAATATSSVSSSASHGNTAKLAPDD